MTNAVVFVVLILIGFGMLRTTLAFLREHHIVSVNYAGDRIPIGTGLFVWLMLLVYLALFVMAERFGYNVTSVKLSLLPAFVSLMSIVFIIGWIDDMHGDKTVKGLRGHLMRFFRKRALSTGLLKAVTVSVLAVWVVYVVLDRDLLAGIIPCMLIPFMTNAMNLFDLRPGRAIKVFLFFALLLILFVPLRVDAFFTLYPVIVAASLLLVPDLQAKAMLGDCGANMLGFALGFCFAAFAALWAQSLLLAFLIAIHVYAEKWSISAMIERHRLLRWFDRLGRTV